MERASDVHIQSLSMPFSSCVVKHTLLGNCLVSYVSFMAYSVLLTPGLKQKKVIADRKITFTVLPVTVKTWLTSEKKLSCKEFLENADKTYQR